MALGQGAFSGAKGELHYKFEGPAKTIVEGDVNGDKKTDFQIELTGPQAARRQRLHTVSRSLRRDLRYWPK